MRTAIVLGTRPEILKNYSIVKALRELGEHAVIIWTGQHTDESMYVPFFRELGYRPDFWLEDYSFGRAIDWVREILIKHEIDTVLVNGDTAAALVGALAALYSDRRLVHVEAGLRSFDPLMYEERNRIMVDSVAHLLLTYTPRESEYLASQPELRGRIQLVGNTTVDLIADHGDLLEGRPTSDRYAFVTLHRKELTDCPDRLTSVCRALSRLSATWRVVFPVHPRTKDALDRCCDSEDLLRGVAVVPPMGPFEALGAIKHAEVVLTDSGCVQEECAILGTPCVTVRENTERHATVEAGINVLSGYDTESIVAAASRQAAFRGPYPDLYGPPGCGTRIVLSMRNAFSTSVKSSELRAPEVRSLPSA